MIRSMTGFGSASFAVGQSEFNIEVRSVNHRHLDVRIRLPKFISSQESVLRELVQKKCSRGKVDLNVSLVSSEKSGPCVEVDFSVVEQYLQVAGKIREQFATAGSLEISTLLSLPGVSRLVEPVLEEEEVVDQVLHSAEEAIDALDQMRIHEGRNLEAEISGRLKAILADLQEIESRAASVQEGIRDRLKKRAEQLREETGILDEGRLHQEVVYWADRLDITEEIVRLRSHEQQFLQIVEQGSQESPVGRKLDFLIQEMGREVNTIGSKANDGPIAHWVVEMKSNLERVREQVQNIE